MINCAKVIKNRRKHFLFVMLFLALAVWPSPSASIVGGTEVTDADDFASHLVGVYNERTKHLCTGTLIRQDLVLTAAHCAYSPSKANSFKVLFGLVLNTRIRTEIRVRTIVIHGGYREDHKGNVNDIALLKLVKDAPSKYRPAYFSTKTDNFKDPSTTYMAVGYGITGIKAKDAGELRTLNVKVKNLASSGKDTLISIDAIDGGGPCNGDSGGPLFETIRTAAGKTRYVLIGIGSQARQLFLNGVKTNRLCKGFSFYTNVPKFSEWIEKNAAQL